MRLKMYAQADVLFEDEKKRLKRMQTGQREIRMMWLMGLTIVADCSMVLAVPLLSGCGIALIMSVMHYVDSIENPSMTLAEQRGIASFSQRQSAVFTFAAFVILIGMVGQWGGLIGLGISGWLFFFSFDGSSVRISIVIRASTAISGDI